MGVSMESSETMIIKEGHEITSDKYANKIITCEADEPIHWVNVFAVFDTLWTAPFAWNHRESEWYMNSAKFIKGKFHLSYAKNSTERLPYKTVITLYDVDHKFVGFYYCAKNSTKISKLKALNHKNVTKTYLNVNGNLLCFKFFIDFKILFSF